MRVSTGFIHGYAVADWGDLTTFAVEAERIGLQASRAKSNARPSPPQSRRNPEAGSVARGEADDEQRLLDVIEAIEEIEKYADRGKPAFETDKLLKTFIVHRSCLGAM